MIAEARERRARHAGILHAAFVVALGYGTLVPLVPAYLRAIGDAGARDIVWHSGALAAAFMVAAALAAPFWGGLSDLSLLARASQSVPGFAGERAYSAHTAQAIDEAVMEIVRAAFERTLDLLTRNREVLESAAALLLERETLTEADLRGTSAQLVSEGRG